MRPLFVIVLISCKGDLGTVQPCLTVNDLKKNIRPTEVKHLCFALFSFEFPAVTEPYLFQPIHMRRHHNEMFAF